MTIPIKVPHDMPLSEIRKLIKAALRKQPAVTVIQTRKP